MSCDASDTGEPHQPWDVRDNERVFVLCGLASPTLHLNLGARWFEPSQPLSQLTRQTISIPLAAPQRLRCKVSRERQAPQNNDSSLLISLNIAKRI